MTKAAPSASSWPPGRVIGHLMLTLGAIWMLLSGGCTVLGVLYCLADVASGPTGVFMSLVVGGVSLIAGLLLLLAGREMAQRARGGSAGGAGDDAP